MDAISSHVAALAGQNLVLIYLAIYLATIFFGNIGAFVSFWLAFQGTLGVWGVPGVLIAAFAANVTGDILWYSMGRRLRTTRLGNWIRRRFPNHGKFDEHIEQKGPRWMLFAKFAYGSNFPILFSLGWAQFNFRRFIRRSLLAIALWLPVILGVSYALYASLSPLADSLVAGADAIRRFEIFFLIGLALFIGVQYTLGKVVKFFV